MPIFKAKNYLFFAIAVLLLVVGFVLLGQGPVYNPLSWTYAPIVLVVTYLVLIPFAILYRENKDKSIDKD